MSISYDIFINTEKTFPEVRSTMEKILNCVMVKSLYADWELYYATVLGLGIGLHGEHTFDDCPEIQFSRYNFYINFDYIPSNYLRDHRHEWQVTMAKILADMLSLNLHCECLVLKDLFIVIDIFKPSEQINMSYDIKDVS